MAPYVAAPNQIQPKPNERDEQTETALLHLDGPRWRVASVLARIDFRRRAGAGTLMVHYVAVPNRIQPKPNERNEQTETALPQLTAPAGASRRCWRVLIVGDASVLVRVDGTLCRRAPNQIQPKPNERNEQTETALPQLTAPAGASRRCWRVLIVGDASVLARIDGTLCRRAEPNPT